MVSAIKHKGKRLYELARAGIEIERAPRRVEIRSFEVNKTGPDQIGFRLRCSKGTYVRSLARDLGEALGTGGCVERLHRSGVGPFVDERAVILIGDERLSARPA